MLSQESFIKASCTVWGVYAVQMCLPRPESSAASCYPTRPKDVHLENLEREPTHHPRLYATPSPPPPSLATSSSSLTLTPRLATPKMLTESHFHDASTPLSASQLRADTQTRKQVDWLHRGTLIGLADSRNVLFRLCRYRRRCGD